MSLYRPLDMVEFNKGEGRFEPESETEQIAQGERILEIFTSTSSQCPASNAVSLTRRSRPFEPRMNSSSFPTCTGVDTTMTSVTATL